MAAHAAGADAVETACARPALARLGRWRERYREAEGRIAELHAIEGEQQPPEAS